MTLNCTRSSNLTTSNGGVFCEMDTSFLCWPRTKSGENVTQNCPFNPMFNSSKTVSRFCSWNGTWEETANKLTLQCLTEENRRRLTNLNKTGEFEIKKFIINFARHLELTGLSLSLITLLISIVIFFHFRSLRNHRTSIHRSLFIATALHVMIRLILYIDQHIPPSIIEEEWQLCVACYILLEYARTAMFTWMFVEGLYLHNVITIAVFQESRYNIIYQCLGWGAPAIFSTIWISFMYQHFDKICLFHYIYLPQFWILEGPRIAFMVVNLIFLILIINVLRQKLRQHRAGHLEQARKSIRAALVLLPLLGVPNLAQMVLEPIDQPAWIFGLWTITTSFLASFQGFFVALLFCFLNGEVRTAVNSWRNVSQDFRTIYTSIHRDDKTSTSGRSLTDNSIYNPKEVFSKEHQPLPI